MAPEWRNGLRRAPKMLRRFNDLQVRILPRAPIGVGSSMAERVAVNHDVVGSTPTRLAAVVLFLEKKMIHIWLDDVRVPPKEGWIWKRTASDMIEALISNDMSDTIVSLDHDLGLLAPEGGYVNNNDPGTGYDVVKFMIATDRIPAITYIHSANPIGAKRMRDLLLDYSREKETPVNVFLRPFRVR
jgi:hypothetical protein